MWIFEVILIVLCVLCGVNGQTTTAKPTCYTPYAHGPGSTCLDKYAALSGHVNCLTSRPTGRPHMVTSRQTDEIEHVHNAVRSRVHPTAGNMQKLSYSGGLGGSALRQSRQCMTSQTTWHQRTAPGAYHPGQNMHVSPTLLSWTDVINVWASENASFTYGGTNDPALVANYTQMIWAETQVVGCGLSECRNAGNTFYLYICHYAPTYDVAMLDSPYQNASKHCAACPAACDVTKTLCDCRGLLCLGGSRLDANTCQCECLKDVQEYNGTICELLCHKNGDSSICGRSPYTVDTCATRLDTIYHCPWMCHACPYASVDYIEGASVLPWQRGLPLCTTTTVSVSPLTGSVKPLTGGDRGAAVSHRTGLLGVVCTMIILCLKVLLD